MEFEGQRFQRSGSSKKGVRDELCDKMIQVINNMETFMGKKKKTKRGNRKARDQKKNLEKREKLIKKLALCGIGTSCALGANGRTSPNIKHVLDASQTSLGLRRLVVSIQKRAGGGRRNNVGSNSVSALSTLHFTSTSTCTLVLS